jgi:hypothetical protein
MAVNERIAIDSGDISAGQLAPSQASRTNFTPGKATGNAGDMNWPKDHRIPTGTPAFGGESAGPVKMQRERVVLLGRNIVCDQTIAAPTTTGTTTTTITSAKEWGTVTPASTETGTVTQDVNGKQERKSGFDNIESA